MPININVKKSF